MSASFFFFFFFFFVSVKILYRKNVSRIISFDRNFESKNYYTSFLDSSSFLTINKLG